MLLQIHISHSLCMDGFWMFFAGSGTHFDMQVQGILLQTLLQSKTNKQKIWFF